jgi:hypothetical protein
VGPLLLAAASSIALGAAPGPAPARVAHAHTRGEGAESCPDEAGLQGNVIARLGYNPFEPSAPLHAVTRIERSARKGFTATLNLGREGEPPRTRALSSTSADCRDIADSLALALALAIDPQYLVREPPPPAPPAPPVASAPPPPVTEPAAAPPPAPPPTPPPASPPPPEPVELTVYATAVGSIGLSPRANLGGAIGLGFQHRAFALYAEGRFDAPASVALSTGSVQTNLIIGSVLPCLQWKRIGGCVSVGVGALQVDGRVAFGRRQTSPVVKVGLRLQYEWMFSAHVGLVARLEVSGVPTRVTVLVDQAPVWSTSPVTADVGLGAIGLF